MPIYRAFRRDARLLSTAVYVDSSFAIGAILADQRFYSDCQRFAELLRLPKYLVVYSEYLLIDTWNGLVNSFVAAAWEEEKTAKGTAELSLRDFRKSNPGLLKTRFTQISNAYLGVTALLHSFRHAEHPVTAAIRVRAFDYMRDYGLYPADAIHAVTAEATGATDIITLDSDYWVLPKSFTVWNPDSITQRIERG